MQLIGQIPDLLQSTKVAKIRKNVATEFANWHSCALALELWLSKLSVAFGNCVHQSTYKYQWLRNVERLF